MTLPAILPALILIGTPGPADSVPAVGAVPSALIQTQPQTAAPVTDAAQPAAPPAAEPSSPPPPAADTPAADQAAAAQPVRTEGDPLEGFNRAMFSLHQTLDKAVFRPAALAYRDVVPKPARSGLRNFFSNLGEPIVALNYLLQLKFGKAAETLGRFAINSTLGVGGLLDVAKTRDFKLPHRSNSFGNTLAFYGVKPGPYLFLPLVGPTTLRDFIGGQGEGFVLPTAVGKPFNRLAYRVPKAVITGLDLRAESDQDLRALLDGAVDPYATLRSAYLQSRQGEVDALRGKPNTVDKPAPGLDEPLEDPAGAAAPPPTAPPPAELSDPLADPAGTIAPTTVPVRR